MCTEILCEADIIIKIIFLDVSTTSFGLTDLHGDGRVHALEEPSGPDFPSGFGFELTFRLIKPTSSGADDITTTASPPTWPAALLQGLAKYVFHTGNSFFAGDHVSWHCPLDGSNVESRLQHMLLAEDLLLPPVAGPLGNLKFIFLFVPKLFPLLKIIFSIKGTVKFLQVVAVTEEELQVAQHWNGIAILELLRRVPS